MDAIVITKEAWIELANVLVELTSSASVGERARAHLSACLIKVSEANPELQDDNGTWFWCTHHKATETSSQCDDCTHVGPFSSKEDAENSEHAKLSNRT